MNRPVPEDEPPDRPPRGVRPDRPELAEAPSPASPTPLLALVAGSGETLSERACLAPHLASLAAALVLFIAVTRGHMWFHADDFDFFVRRGLHGAELSIWTPHNEHWSTIPILLWRALFSIYGMHTAVPYLVALFVLHLALAFVLWKGMCQMGADPIVATLIAADFALFGAGGAATLLFEFQIGFVGALLLGWVFVLLVNHEGPLGRRDVLAGVASIGALMFSGVAVTMVVVGGLVALVRRGWIAAVVAVAPATIVYGVWFALAGRIGLPGTGMSWQHLVRSIPGFTVTGIVHSFDVMTGSRLISVVLTLGLVVWIAGRPWRKRPNVAPALMGLAGAVIFFLDTAVVRANLGEHEAMTQRYTYVAVALMLPAIGVAVSALLPRHRIWRLAALAVLVVVSIADFGVYMSVRNGFSAVGLQTERQVVAAVRIASTGPTIPGSRPIANLNAAVFSLPALERFAHAGELPSGLRPKPFDVANAATELQLGLTTAPLFATRGAVMSPASSAMRVSGTPTGCQMATADGARGALSIVVSSPTSLRLVTDAAGTMTAKLILAGARGAPRTFMLEPGTVWWDMAVSPSRLHLLLPAGATLASC